MSKILPGMLGLLSGFLLLYDFGRAMSGLMTVPDYLSISGIVILEFPFAVFLIYRSVCYLYGCIKAKLLFILVFCGIFFVLISSNEGLTARLLYWDAAVNRFVSGNYDNRITITGEQNRQRQTWGEGCIASRTGFIFLLERIEYSIVCNGRAQGTLALFPRSDDNASIFIYNQSK